MKTAFSHFFASLPMTSLSQRHQRDGWVTATDSLRLRARPAKCENAKKSYILLLNTLKCQIFNS